jgi:hypothetical protein
MTETEGISTVIIPIVVGVLAFAIGVLQAQISEHTAILERLQAEHVAVCADQEEGDREVR